MTARRQETPTRRQRGAALAELAVVLPILVTMLLVAIDFGRLVYTTQIMVDLTREAANLVSRGATFDDAFLVTFRRAGEVDVRDKGGVIISEVRRKDFNDPTPWIVNQERRGALATATSRVGAEGGPARIPDITRLPAGAGIMAVEIVHPFNPLFDATRLHLNFYPEAIYEVAFF
jgi:hypothetical protein